MALKSSSLAGREEGSWSKLSSRPSGGKSSQRGRQVKALSSHIEHCHFYWLCEGQIVWWLFVYNGHQLMLPPRFLTSFAETLRPPLSSVLFSLFCFYWWSSSSPTGFTRSTKFVSIACPSDLQYLFSFSISFSHHGHICHCNHNCLQPSLSYNFRLGVRGRMGDNFFQRLLSNKKQIQLWHSHCDEEIGREGKKKY